MRVLLVVEDNWDLLDIYIDELNKRFDEFIEREKIKEEEVRCYTCNLSGSNYAAGRTRDMS